MCVKIVMLVLERVLCQIWKTSAATNEVSSIIYIGTLRDIGLHMINYWGIYKWIIWYRSMTVAWGITVQWTFLFPYLCSQYLYSKRGAMNSCSLCEMSFYVMFTFPLFILHVINWPSCNTTTYNVKNWVHLSNCTKN